MRLSRIGQVIFRQNLRGGPFWEVNAWDNGFYYVAAGTLRDDPESGLIQVSTVRASEDGNITFYQTPVKAGFVQIIDAQNERVILQAKDSTVFYFDLPSRRFVSSLTEIVSTATPAPLWTQSPTQTPSFSDDAADDIYSVYQNRPAAANGETSPMNSDLRYTIYPPNDVDWFWFYFDTPGALIVTLSDLAANYDLYVYNAEDRTYWANSTNEGLASEEVVFGNAPVGTYYVQISGVNGASHATEPYTLRFLADRTPPTLTLSVNPTTLWPPNHKLVTVKVTKQATDDFDPNPVIQLVSITSSEPDNGQGDGDMAGDIVIKPDGTIQLRAERAGNGPGRIYTLTYSVTDRSGNQTTRSVTVTVPPDK